MIESNILFFHHVILDSLDLLPIPQNTQFSNRSVYISKLRKDLITITSSDPLNLFKICFLDSFLRNKNVFFQIFQLQRVLQYLVMSISDIFISDFKLADL